MQTLAFISRKGGSGKTTLAVHMAVCAVQSGQFVVLVDLDPQGSASDWHEMRGSSKEFVSIKAKPEDLPGLLGKAAEAGADLVIIDTAPHTDKSALMAARNADLILVPCRPSTFDLRALGATFDLLEHSSTPAAIVINFAPFGHLGTETAAQLTKAGYPVLETMISQRVAFSHAVADGRAVHEYEPEGKAAQEITALFETIKERLAPCQEQRKICKA
jgi:chromosome partitioning protein